MDSTSKSLSRIMQPHLLLLEFYYCLELLLQKVWVIEGQGRSCSGLLYLMSQGKELWRDMGVGRGCGRHCLRS